MSSAKTVFVAGLVVMCMSVAARGAFTKPSEAQVAVAANSPSANMTALLKDASAEQAAQVVKVVVVKALGLGLAADVQTARIAAVINSAFVAVSPQMRMAFCSALGAAVAGSGVIVVSPGVVSIIQSAIATAGGTDGVALAEAFGISYLGAQQNLDGTGQKTKNDPPPVASPYEGQSIP